MTARSGMIGGPVSSIEERVTGKKFITEMHVVEQAEINTVHKKDGWQFNWKKEFKEPNHAICK